MQLFQGPNSMFDRADEIFASHSNVEVGCQTLKVRLLERKVSRVLLLIAFSILSGGVLAILLLWYKQLRWRVIYVSSKDLSTSTHLLVYNEDGSVSVQKIIVFQIRNPITCEMEQQSGFVNRRLNFTFSRTNYKFCAVEFPITSIPFAQFAKMEKLNEKRVIELRREYGSNEKYIKIPQIHQFMLKEMTSPIYFLQYASFFIWLAQKYTQFAIIIISLQLVISLFSYAMTTVFLLKIRKLTLQKQLVKIFRQEYPDGKQLPATELVVGDLIELQNQTILPCDCFLLSGQLLLNEVSLTGESLPISKFPIHEEDQTIFSYQSADHKKVKDGERVLAVVVRSGFSSFKGQILRSVLYPRPTEFDFSKNTIKFVMFIGVFALVVFGARIPQMVSIDIGLKIIFYRFFDTVTWVIPPFLPVFQTLSLFFSLTRLKQKNILGIEPQKTLVAGKVTHMCFDKTGTLTTNGIIVRGYFDQTLDSMKDQQINQDKINDILLFKLFATCHGVHKIDSELTGDMLDIQMLKYSGYSLDSDETKEAMFTANQDNSALQVLRLFDFDSQVARMSVIVRDLNCKKSYIFLKGAPEKVKEICDKSTIPKSFDQKLNELSLKGFRVLGLAYSEIDYSQVNFSKFTRADTEKCLNFLGFLILENNLKEDTAEVIERLRTANINCKIISGDNPLTTIQTATECSIIQSYLRIFLLQISTTGKQKLTIHNINNGKIEEIDQDSQTTQHILTSLIQEETQFVITGSVLTYLESRILELINDEEEINEVHLSIINETYRPLIQNDSSERIVEFSSNMRQKVRKSSISKTYILLETFQELIKRTKVFARMRPDQKRRIIEIHQQLKLATGMIGDGSNDCEAIKQADIGISFSSADASLTAPFSSTSESISCVEVILKEGRATLSNNIEILQNLVIQNMLKFVGCMVMIQDYQNYSGNQFTFLGFFGGMPLLALLALSGPSNMLSQDIPDTNFHKLPNLFSAFSQIFFYSIAQVVMGIIVWNLSSFEPKHSLDEDQLYMEGYFNTFVFYLTFFFFLNTGVTLYKSSPFKLKIYFNYFLAIFIILYVTFWLSLALFPLTGLTWFDLSTQFLSSFNNRITLVLVAMTTSICVFLVEELVAKKIRIRLQENSRKGNK